MWILIRKNEGGEWNEFPKIRKWIFSENELERTKEKLNNINLKSYVILEVNPIWRAFSYYPKGYKKIGEKKDIKPKLRIFDENGKCLNLTKEEKKEYVIKPIGKRKRINTPY